jgi:phosphate acetyltransferase
MSFPTSLLERAARLRRRIVLTDGGDPRVQAAAARLADERIAEPILIGGPGIDPVRDPRLQRVAHHLRDRRPDRVRDGLDALDQAADPIRFGAGLVALGEADGCVAGANTSTAEVVQAVRWAIGAAAGVERVSSAFYLMPEHRGVLTLTDCAVVPDPTAAQLAGIALAAARDRIRLVGDTPRVAFLSFSTRGSAAGPSVEKVREAVRRFGVLAPEIAADGELQVDAAISPEAARHKAPDSVLQGAANVLVVPDLDAGNIAYRLLRELTALELLGPILQGLVRPMSGLSRGATPDHIVQVVAAVALQGDPQMT